MTGHCSRKSNEDRTIRDKIARGCLASSLIKIGHLFLASMGFSTFLELKTKAHIQSEQRNDRHKETTGISLVESERPTM
eukprot:3932283-Amphidinium_carterae.1